ncbi:hypothetical protein M9Y10_009962 [Tritrichomonas musculus]|uniref:Uncharacterized protein n=1 Tax=Tritrichomonas musculus TaxID=1915356 RepID=A0ABR2IRE8_9EUKA
MKSEEDYSTNDGISSSSNFAKRKVKKHKKRKTPKKGSSSKKPMTKINLDQFISSDAAYNEKGVSDENFRDDNSYYQYNENGDYMNYGRFEKNNDYYDDQFYNAEKGYDFTVEELFEEMVCKVGDYFQDATNDLIDNFCCDLLYLLDDNRYIEECVDSFCDEIINEVKIIFDEVKENEFPQNDFNEDDADLIFEPFSDPFFAAFLDAFDFSNMPIKPTSNKIRKIRTKVSSIARVTKEKLENSYFNMTLQLNEIDEIQNSINRILIQNDANIITYEGLKKQNYKYLCQLNLLETQIELIGLKTNFYSHSSPQGKIDINSVSREDVNASIQVLSKDIQFYLNDQTSLKKIISDKQIQLKKYRNDVQEMHNDFYFINGMMNNFLKMS